MKSTIIYANSIEEARSKVESKFGMVKRIQPLGVNHMGNPYYRVSWLDPNDED